MLIKDKNDFETAETEQLPPCFGRIHLKKIFV